MIGLIILGVVVLLVIYGISVYNKLVSYRVETDNAWSQIDVQLKRRYDLIPNLVETVKGVMNFEKDTLTRVIEARAGAMGAKTMGERMKSEGELSGALGRLMAVWENYPDLKSNQNAMKLQEELVTTENRISFSRSHYNDIVSNFNTMLQQFPSSIIAGFGNFKAKEFFNVPEAEKVNPQVKF